MKKKMIPALCFIIISLCAGTAANAQNSKADTLKNDPRAYNDNPPPHPMGDTANREKINPNKRPLDPNPITMNSNRRNDAFDHPYIAFIEPRREQ